MNILSLPRNKILYALTCGLGLLAIFIVIFYSDYRNLAKLDKKIEELNAKIESQKLYSPVFQELFKRIRFKQPEELPFPKMEKLAREDIPKVATVLRGIAGQDNLKVEQISPDVESSINGSKHLMINLILKGDLPQLRKFLYHLGGIPYLEQIERLQIQTGEEGREFRLKIWMTKKE